MNWLYRQRFVIYGVIGVFILHYLFGCASTPGGPSGTPQPQSVRCIASYGGLNGYCDREGR